MKCEVRDGKLHLSGYVNAVERDSRVIVTKRGRCVEQVKAGAFAASMADGHEIRMMFNHKRDIGSTADGTLKLEENDIGLYAEAVTDDEELMELAGKGELRGWSFGFEALDDEMEQRSGDVPRRHVKALDLREVSILSITPAYKGTSLEYRSYEEEAEVNKADELRSMADTYRLRGYLIRKRIEQRELEERYNHYHDPKTGQFASGGGGGYGLYYSMGKGKGAVVGSSNDISGSNVYNKSKENSHYGDKKTVNDEVNRLMQSAQVGDVYEVADRWGNKSNVRVENKHIYVNGRRYAKNKGNFAKYMVNSQKAKLVERKGADKGIRMPQESAQLSLFG